MGILLKTFYHVKPLIPRRLQIAMRRIRARIKLRTHGNVWPIDEKAATRPENWKGWPEGKRFAFVLTHDVESAKGQDRCRQLIDLERKLGFTASYNFVPERYQVREELRNYLTENGFEVGVHGLNHDGKYYNSFRIFQERTKKINRYIKEWNSVGFRSPSMLHNLDWIHGLDIMYDSSTFDTDPFEPQPDGVGTIFPFWVSSGNGSEGFIEIPYTLPQDFTLFVIFQHKTIDIWKRKLDRIASKGGMAMMSIHPDFINFTGTDPSIEEYPVSYYEEFLRYVKTRYRGEYWQPLPRDVARFCSPISERSTER
jgi:hypothetical protein